MDIVVRTGETKSGAGTSLAALSFSSPHGEHACLLLHGGAETRDGKTLRDECNAIMQHSLLGTEGEAWTRLDGTLKELNGLFKGFIISGTLEDIHAVVAIVDRSGQLHISTAGRGEAYLIRGGTASQITEFSKGKPVSAFIHISSGSLEPGDTVALSTQRLLRAMTPAQLSQLVHRGEQFLHEVVDALEGEKESAALASIVIPGKGDIVDDGREDAPVRGAVPSRRSGRRTQAGVAGMVRGIGERLLPFARIAGEAGLALGKSGASRMMSGSGGLKSLQEKGKTLLSDLKDPRRKRRAHLFLLAGAVGAFLVVWVGVSLATSSQRSKTRSELSDLVTQIKEEIQTADNRRLAGDMDGANAVLERAEQQAKQVTSNKSGDFRAEALDLLDSIRSKREEINNVLRVPARVLVNMSTKNSNISAQGLVGLGEGEFLVYDRESSYRVLLNRLDEPKQLVDDDLILQGTNFSRYKSQIFMTTGNSLLELSANQIVPMKTEDPAGWTTGKDIETYLRYLYILAPDKKQIFKYERLSNRYAAPVQYNVNGDLTGAIDMAIDSSVFVLKEGGTILKLLRGEAQPFIINHAPGGTPTASVATAGTTYELLAGSTKMYKVPDGNLYFLDPTKNRVIVTTDGGGSGEASYVKQYILEGEQLGTLQDLYVDPEEGNMYVLDEKRIYVIDLATK